MSKENKTLSRTMGRLVNTVMICLGTILGYAGSMLVAAYLLPVIFSPLSRFFDVYFPYTLFDGKASVVGFVFVIITLAISLAYFVKAIRRFSALMSGIPNEFLTTWQKYWKVYFAVGFWAGLCLFLFLWGILVPIL